jgi:DNA replication and repair protein RecF
LVWVRHLSINDLRNIRHVSVELHPQLNVFCGRNAQGKTSLLEAVGLLARGRSFRTDDSPSLIRHGRPCLVARGEVDQDGLFNALEVELHAGRRRLRVDGRDVSPRDYHGRLEAVVYSTDRLRVIRGTMRDRRQFLDRSAAALWPSYRAELRAFERVLRQRNVALQERARDLSVWTDQLVEHGARLRLRRAAYAARLTDRLARGYRPGDEDYDVLIHPHPTAREEDERGVLAAQLRSILSRELAAGRTLAGPHRDQVKLLLNGRDAAVEASSGQARSFLLALALASLEVYRQETGRRAVALLDDLDSELDRERTQQLCTEVSAQAQALVTSAHPAWAEDLRPRARLFLVSEGAVHDV